MDNSLVQIAIACVVIVAVAWIICLIPLPSPHTYDITVYAEDGSVIQEWSDCPSLQKIRNGIRFCDPETGERIEVLNADIVFTKHPAQS